MQYTGYFQGVWKFLVSISNLSLGAHNPYCWNSHFSSFFMYRSCVCVTHGPCCTNTWNTFSVCYVLFFFWFKKLSPTTVQVSIRPDLFLQTGNWDIRNGGAGNSHGLNPFTLRKYRILSKIWCIMYDVYTCMYFIIHMWVWKNVYQFH